jgi:hypothetical protein
MIKKIKGELENSFAAGKKPLLNLTKKTELKKIVKRPNNNGM